MALKLSPRCFSFLLKKGPNSVVFYCTTLCRGLAQVAKASHDPHRWRSTFFLYFCFFQRRSDGLTF